jgi:hypothetical protein
MAHHNDGDAPALGKARELMRSGADLGDGARGRFDRVEPHGLDRVDDGELGLLRVERRENVAEVGRGGKLHRAFSQAEAVRRIWT